MLSSSLFVVAATLFYRKLDQGLGWFCIATALLGCYWPTLLLLPYLVITWRTLRGISQAAYDRPIRTKFPLFIGRSNSQIANCGWSLSNWIIAVELPPEELSADGDQESGCTYLVTKAVKEAISGNKKQFKKSKADLENQNYQLYHVGWAHKPDMSAITVNEPISQPEYSCQEFALNLAFQISSSKLYTYFSSIALLRRDIGIGYVLLILFAQYDMYGVQPTTMLFPIPFGSAAMLNLIAAVEIHWLHLGTQLQSEEITYEKIKDWLQRSYLFVLDVYNLAVGEVPVHEHVTVDLAQKSETTGSKLVETVVDRIGRSAIFENDFGYVRRISWVETKDGMDYAQTFRPNYHGGLWQVDEVVFRQTKDTNTYPGLVDQYEKINSEFDVDWSTVQWKDLRKPLYCALAVQLYMFTREEKIPLNVQDQAEHWRKNYNRENKEVETFVAGVVDMDSLNLGGNFIAS